MSLIKAPQPTSQHSNVKFFDVILNIIHHNSFNRTARTLAVEAFVILKQGILNGEITDDNLVRLQKILVDYRHIFHDTTITKLVQDILAYKSK